MLPGIKFLNIGLPGSGKTFSTRSIPPEFEVFYIFTEPSQILISDLPNAHWHYIPATQGVDWNTLKRVAQAINRLQNEDLQKAHIGNKTDFQQWLRLIDVLNNFEDQKTGQAFGDVTTWGTDRVLVMDGLTGLTKMSRALQSGGKPLLTQPDYGVIMQNIALLLDYLTDNLRCHFILIAHLEIERDEITGQLYRMVSTIGRRLAPTIPARFDEVVISEQTGGRFVWHTVAEKATTKARLLPLQQNIPQDFSLLFKTWKDRGGVITPTKEAKP